MERITKKKNLVNWEKRKFTSYSFSMLFFKYIQKVNKNGKQMYMKLVILWHDDDFSRGNKDM